MMSLNFAYLINILLLYSGMIIKFLHSLVLNSLVPEVALLKCCLAKAALPLHLQNIFGVFTNTITLCIASYYCDKMLVNLSRLHLLSIECQFFGFLFFRMKEKISLECTMEESVFPVQQFLLNCKQLRCFKRRVAWSVTPTASSSLVYCFYHLPSGLILEARSMQLSMRK